MYLKKIIPYRMYLVNMLLIFFFLEILPLDSKFFLKLLLEIFKKFEYFFEKKKLEYLNIKITIFKMFLIFKKYNFSF